MPPPPPPPPQQSVLSGFKYVLHTACCWSRTHICWIFLSWQCCFFPLSAPYIWTRDTYNTKFFVLFCFIFFSVPAFLKDLFGSLEISQSQLCRHYGRWKVSLSLSKPVCNFLDSGKTDFLISVVFCFSFLIHLGSKATGSYSVFFLFFLFFQFFFFLLLCWEWGKHKLTDRPGCQ